MKYDTDALRAALNPNGAKKLSAKKRKAQEELERQHKKQVVEKTTVAPVARTLHVPYTYKEFNRDKLPIFQNRERITKSIEKYDNLIIYGQTGSGKTTQIPQYIFESRINKKALIGVTQPRRVAAITLAERVAKEKKCPLGKQVGFQVRFQDESTGITQIKFLTDGILLRISLDDSDFSKFSVIVLDEAHERTINTDVLFGLAKAAQKRRSTTDNPLKIIVMSATMNIGAFQTYFNNAHIEEVQGRQYKIEDIYLKKSLGTDYTIQIIATILEINQTEEPGHILVFCTGQSEIDDFCNDTWMRHIDPKYPTIKAYPLYAALPSHLQMQIFEEMPQIRKVIFATNIAETSITIPGVRYVIDSGFVKMKTFNPVTGFDILESQRCSLQQVTQRRGRAGRESSGKCYHMYTKKQQEKFVQEVVPEIQRSNISNVLLQLVALKIEDVKKFDFMDPPPEPLINRCLHELRLLGAISNDRMEITPEGLIMSQFPLDPKFSKVLIASAKIGCSEEILSIIAMLSVGSVFYSPSHEKDTHVNLFESFQSVTGDHLMLLKILQEYKGATKKQSWCVEKHLDQRKLKQASDIRNQLREICLKQKIKLVSCHGKQKLVRKALCYGFFMNSAALQNDGSFKALESNEEVHLYPTSKINRKSESFVIYTELIKTTKNYMRTSSAVEKDWLIEAAPKSFKRHLKFLNNY